MTSTASLGLRDDRGRVLAAVMLTTGLIALEATVIATAVPSIVRDLGGFSQFPWLFSVYLLTLAVTVPLYGAFADAIGRKPVLFFGIALFLVGSVLCGFAWSMPALIVARAVQGVGAGAVQPICVTIVGDLYTVEERARVQGYLAAVWGISAVVGPTLGGVFAEYLSWRWIFFVNLPLGAVAVWTLARRFRENVERTAHRVDYAGAALLTGGFSLLILGLLEGGTAWAWVSVPSVAVLGGGVLLVAAFLLVERRAAEPVLPLWVFGRRILVVGNLAALVVGWLMIGVSSFLPTYAQGVLGTGPLTAGFALAAMTVGWPISAGLSGRLYLRIGFRATALIGSVFVTLGAVQAALLGRDSSVWAAAAAAFTMGLGFGLSASPTVVAVQSAVGWASRGTVTGANMFARSLGSAIGVAVFGAIANGVLADRFARAPSSVAAQLPPDVDAANTLLLEGTAPAAALEYLRTALDTASHYVFVALVPLALLQTLALLFLPRTVERVDDYGEPHTP